MTSCSDKVIITVILSTVRIEGSLEEDDQWTDYGNELSLKVKTWEEEY